jgi:hypothetical protein
MTLFYRIPAVGSKYVAHLRVLPNPLGCSRIRLMMYFQTTVAVVRRELSAPNLAAPPPTAGRWFPEGGRCPGGRLLEVLAPNVGQVLLKNCSWNDAPQAAI